MFPSSYQITHLKSPQQKTKWQQTLSSALAIIFASQNPAFECKYQAKSRQQQNFKAKECGGIHVPKRPGLKRVRSRARARKPTNAGRENGCEKCLLCPAKWWEDFEAAAIAVAPRWIYWLTYHRCFWAFALWNIICTKGGATIRSENQQTFRT